MRNSEKNQTKSGYCSKPRTWKKSTSEASDNISINKQGQLVAILDRDLEKLPVRFKCRTDSRLQFFCISSISFASVNAATASFIYATSSIEYFFEVLVRRESVSFDANLCMRESTAFDQSKNSWPALLQVEELVLGPAIWCRVLWRPCHLFRAVKMSRDPTLPRRIAWLVRLSSDWSRRSERLEREGGRGTILVCEEAAAHGSGAVGSGEKST